MKLRCPAAIICLLPCKHMPAGAFLTEQNDECCDTARYWLKPVLPMHACLVVPACICKAALASGAVVALYHRTLAAAHRRVICVLGPLVCVAGRPKGSSCTLLITRPKRAATRVCLHSTDYAMQGQQGLQCSSSTVQAPVNHHYLGDLASMLGEFFRLSLYAEQDSLLPVSALLTCLHSEHHGIMYAALSVQG